MDDYFDFEMQRVRRCLLDDLWRRTVGLLEKGYVRPTFEELQQTEWSPQFEKLMRGRLIQGAIRYGRMRAIGKKHYDWPKAIKQRIEEYEKTGNMEMLVDIANGCMLEFEECRHPKRHFKSVDDLEHVETK